MLNICKKYNFFGKILLLHWVFFFLALNLLWREVERTRTNARAEDGASAAHDEHFPGLRSAGREGPGDYTGSET